MHVVASISVLSYAAFALGYSAETKRAADQPQFDIYEGPNNQDAVFNSPASDLEYTLSGGQPFFNPYISDRLGTKGPILLQSVNLIEQLAHFVRERVPERTVHAKGAGAHGYFEVTTDIGAKYCMADVFSEIGKRTSVTARLSTIAGNLGNPDAVRDLRGLGFKLRTTQGILDWVFLNHPVFWLRDPAKFPHFIHSQKRHPSTHQTNYNDFWDYLSANNESIHQVMRTFSDLGTPYGFRHMNGHSGNTFRAVKADGSWHYLKVSAISDQGIKNNTIEEAIRQSGENPDFGITDLYNAIESGNYPSWTVYFQVMTAQQAEKFKYNIFDLTKEWLAEDVPLQEVGRITLNQNPTNYHQEVEQIGFDPAHLPPGLEPSEDPTLQARFFAYADAQRYRIGINHKQLPINCPLNPVANFVRDGAMAFNNQGRHPNFMSTQDQIQLPQRYYNDDNHTIWVGGAVKFLSTTSEIDFDQARGFWSRLTHGDQENLIKNVIGHLGLATDARIKQKQVHIFAHVNATLGQRIAQGVNITLS
ncbi:catalase-like domain-containing protein [Crucibulum laeve]|uniref:Catalase n=1 Tax=Crucibulum laeve TaxID=68775 RepID=A0A5C3MED1_9AGAR|nr:catalase-like domain-containing protein [Crucibulum laeve]